MGDFRFGVDFGIRVLVMVGIVGFGCFCACDSSIDDESNIEADAMGLTTVLSVSMLAVFETRKRVQLL